jgi:hypothetical protein
MAPEYYLELPHRSSTATGYKIQQATLSCPHMVAQAQQQAIKSTYYLALTRSAQQQQAMYQQAILSLSTIVYSNRLMYQQAT